MRKRLTIKHKKEVRRRYEKLRSKAYTILKNKHKKEYKLILKRLKGKSF